MNYLPDVNVWIALVAERHPSITRLGFLQLLTNKHVMQEEVINPEGAWQTYRMLRSDRRIGYLTEQKGLHETWVPTLSVD